MMMPMMTGEELAAEFIKIRPDIPVIMCSGHSHMIDKETAVKKGIRSFMAKPIRMGEMSQKVREVLDNR